MKKRPKNRDGKIDLLLSFSSPPKFGFQRKKNPETYDAKYLINSFGSVRVGHHFILRSRTLSFSSLTPSSYVGLEPTEEGEKRDKELEEI